MQGEDVARVLEKDLALWSERDRTGAARQQCAAGLSFETLDLRTDCGLGEVQPLRCPGEATALRDADKSTKQLVVEHGTHNSAF